MTQLRQRVIAACHLPALDLSDTRAYIEHRIKTVGGKGDPAFDDEALEQIHAFTGGVPRRINTLCDRLMVLGFIEEKHVFGGAEVREVITEIQLEMPGSGQLGRWASLEAVLPGQPDVGPDPLDTIPVGTGEGSERPDRGGI